MASLPQTDPSQRFLSAEELLKLRGTPEFEAEYRRQVAAIAEHDRKNHRADRTEVYRAALSDCQ